MAIGPVQLVVLGFEHPEFHGEIIAELERLKDSDTVRVIDALAVHKDADGAIEVAHLSNLSKRSYADKSPFVFTGTVRKVVFDVNPHLTEAHEKDLHEHAQWAHAAHAINA
jgi:uncharacterized membrane protein